MATGRVLSKRNWLIAAGGLVLVVVVTLALGGSGIRSYPDGSPEAAAQRWLQSMFDEDLDEALDLMTPALRLRCDKRDLEYGPTYWEDTARLGEVIIDGDDATVEVELTSDGSGLFGGGSYSPSYRLDLVRRDGAWLIAGLDDRGFGCI